MQTCLQAAAVHLLQEEEDGRHVLQRHSAPHAHGREALPAHPPGKYRTFTSLSPMGNELHAITGGCLPFHTSCRCPGPSIGADASQGSKVVARRWRTPGMAGCIGNAPESVHLCRSTRSTMLRCSSGKTATWTTSSTSSKATGATSSACEPPAPLWHRSTTPTSSAHPACRSLAPGQATLYQHAVNVGPAYCRRQRIPCQASSASSTSQWVKAPR